MLPLEIKLVLYFHSSISQALLHLISITKINFLYILTTQDYYPHKFRKRTLRICNWFLSNIIFHIDIVCQKCCTVNHLDVQMATLS